MSDPEMVELLTDIAPAQEQLLELARLCKERFPLGTPPRILQAIKALVDDIDLKGDVIVEKVADGKVLAQIKFGKRFEDLKHAILIGEMDGHHGR